MLCAYTSIYNTTYDHHSHTSVSLHEDVTGVDHETGGSKVAKRPRKSKNPVDATEVTESDVDK